MAYIACYETYDDNDDVECSTEIVPGTNLCIYCDNIDNYPQK